MDKANTKLASDKALSTNNQMVVYHKLLYGSNNNIPFTQFLNGSRVFSSFQWNLRSVQKIFGV